jgi:hypothetical protein
LLNRYTGLNSYCGFESTSLRQRYPLIDSNVNRKRTLSGLAGGQPEDSGQMPVKLDIEGAAPGLGVDHDSLDQTPKQRDCLWPVFDALEGRSQALDPLLVGRCQVRREVDDGRIDRFLQRRFRLDALSASPSLLNARVLRYP